MNRWLTIALAGVTLAAGALLLGTTPQLPARVATHFDWSGNPNDWMDRETYLVFMLGFSVGLPWITFAIMRFQRGVRNRDYWLAPPRRDASLRAVSAFAAATGLAMALFITSIHLAIVSAHATQPIHLDNGKLVTALVLFATAMIGLAIVHGLRFRR